MTMKKFLKENWFKLIIVVVLVIIGGSCVYYFTYVLPAQKQQELELEKLRYEQDLKDKEENKKQIEKEQKRMEEQASLEKQEKESAILSDQIKEEKRQTEIYREKCMALQAENTKEWEEFGNMCFNSNSSENCTNNPIWKAFVERSKNYAIPKCIDLMKSLNDKVGVD